MGKWWTTIGTNPTVSFSKDGTLTTREHRPGFDTVLSLTLTRRERSQLARHMLRSLLPNPDDPNADQTPYAEEGDVRNEQDDHRLLNFKTQEGQQLVVGRSSAKRAVWIYVTPEKFGGHIHLTREEASRLRDALTNRLSHGDDDRPLREALASHLEQIPRAYSQFVKDNEELQALKDRVSRLEVKARNMVDSQRARIAELERALDRASNL